MHPVRFEVFRAETETGSLSPASKIVEENAWPVAAEGRVVERWDERSAGCAAGFGTERSNTTTPWSLLPTSARRPSRLQSISFRPDVLAGRRGVRRCLVSRHVRRGCDHGPCPERRASELGSHVSRRLSNQGDRNGPDHLRAHPGSSRPDATALTLSALSRGQRLDHASRAAVKCRFVPPHPPCPVVVVRSRRSVPTLRPNSCR